MVFDLKTLARIKDIKSTGETPDSIVYDSATQRVFAFNGRGHNATVIDAVSNEVAGTIALDAKPEEARADGAGPRLRKPRGQEQPRGHRSRARSPCSRSLP